MSKKTQDLFIAIGLLLVGYFFGDTVAKFNNYSPVKIPETVDEVRDVGVFKKDGDKDKDGSNNNENVGTIAKFDDSRRDWDKMEMVTVKYIIDGDTIILSNGEKVRYVGMDTPERGQCWYRQAKEFNRKLVSGKKIRLERDESNQDRYQRLLRYIYVKNIPDGKEIFVNLELVKAGLARAKEYKPDTEYSSGLKEAENYAKQNKIGLWGGCEE